jgi:hypothetical protein
VAIEGVTGEGNIANENDMQNERDSDRQGESPLLGQKPVLDFPGIVFERMRLLPINLEQPGRILAHSIFLSRLLGSGPSLLGDLASARLQKIH